MKKTLKKLLAAMSAAAVLSASSICSLYSSALLIQRDFISEAYQEHIANRQVVANEEELLPLFSPYALSSSYKVDCKHIYESYDYDYSSEVGADFSGYSSFYFEFGDDKIRVFHPGFVNWNCLYGIVDNTSVYTEENINEFLIGNNFKVQLKELTFTERNSSPTETYICASVILDYDEKATLNDVIKTTIALYNEFGLFPNYELFMTSTSFEAEILYGDANGDNELNVSDAAFIARTLAKRETIDVTTNPAADYNNDGKVTVSDAATIARDLAKKGL